MFVLALLQNEFGGNPAFGVDLEGRYVIVCTCQCEECVGFRKVYRVKPYPTVLAAAKAYGDDRICHYDTLDTLEAGGLVH